MPCPRRGEERERECRWEERIQNLQKYHDLYQHGPHYQLVTADVLAYPHCGPQDGEYEDYEPQTGLHALEYEIGDWFQRSTGEENDLGRVEEQADEANQHGKKTHPIPAGQKVSWLVF